MFEHMRNPITQTLLGLTEVRHTHQSPVDHNLYEVRLSMYLLTFVYSKNIRLGEILQLFTHLNYFSSAAWHYPRPLSPSLCRSEQYNFIYTCTSNQAAVICIYVENPPFLLPIYNLEHHQKSHPRTKDIC